jgi:hypothetical protein
MIRKISRWHRDQLGAERKAARRKCSKALAPILDVIRKNAVHASVKAVGASRNAPHNAAPSLPHLEASRTVLHFAAAARGQEHRDEAERMKEAAPEDSQASSGSLILAIIFNASCRRSSINCSTAASRMSSAKLRSSHFETRIPSE